jgi:hypothetical protein
MIGGQAGRLVAVSLPHFCQVFEGGGDVEGGKRDEEEAWRCEALGIVVGVMIG